MDLVRGERWKQADGNATWRCPPTYLGYGSACRLLPRDLSTDRWQRGIIVQFSREQVVSTAVSWMFPLCANILAALISLSITCAHAEAPKQLSAFGLALGQPPESVQSLLSHLLPNCSSDPSIYHESEGYADKITAILDVGQGSRGICRSGPEGDQVQHTLSLTFAHPSIAAGRPLYQIKWHRAFPDVALAPHAKMEYSFDKARSELFRTYGRPTEVREEKTTTAAAKNAQREDKLVRYLWATKGRLPKDLQSTVCDCGSRYVIATLAISSSPSTIPKNQFFVLSLNIFVRDNDIGARQDEWNAQWQKVK